MSTARLGLLTTLSPLRVWAICHLSGHLCNTLRRQQLTEVVLLNKSSRNRRTGSHLHVRWQPGLGYGGARNGQGSTVPTIQHVHSQGPVVEVPPTRAVETPARALRPQWEC